MHLASAGQEVKNPILLSTAHIWHRGTSDPQHEPNEFSACLSL